MSESLNPKSVVSASGQVHYSPQQYVRGNSLSKLSVCHPPIDDPKYAGVYIRAATASGG
jgi:hypothetical protein